MSPKTYWIMLFLLLSTLAWGMPPHPGKQDTSAYPEVKIMRRGATVSKTRVDAIPQTVLAIMVEFADVKFDEVADEPDNLAHDSTFVDAGMRHLQEFWQDASHGNYIFDYDVYDRVVLSKNMTYYGDDDYRERIVEMVEETVDLIDPVIDFNNYDAYIIFHAGAGQESDLHDSNPGTIWSTFVNYWDMKEVYDPDDENPDFMGIPTQDGPYMTEVSIVPESQRHSDFTPDDPILGLLGVLAHEFGHQLGLPTLYDNYSSNGRSSGIGNFGVMGTGAWNALGYVPPMPCAWSRAYLGWENVIEINENFQNAEIDYVLSDDATTTKVYKVPITDKEYFLLENRQQNPDGSTSQATGEPSFTFALLDEGQEYYPEGHDNAGDPRFNWVKNSYLGCEWDFYLPGYGGPEVPVQDGNDVEDRIIDGSGILIWHIDEYVIDECFTPDFEYNCINATAKHKGVDLEEADGVQHMDSYYPDVCRSGSPRDAYREGNNSYFGMSVNPDNGMQWLPTAESYYGGTPVEITDIGPSGLVMEFSAVFEWNLDAGYAGTNPFPALVDDFDEDGVQEIFYPMPNGELHFWRGDEPLVEGGFPENIFLQGSIEQMYAYDEETDTFLIPCKQETGFAFSYIFTPRDSTFFKLETFMNKSWACPPVILPTSVNGYKALLPLHNDTASEIAVLDENWNVAVTWQEDDSLRTNLIYNQHDEAIYSFYCSGVNQWVLRKRPLNDPFNPTDKIIGGLSDVEALPYILSADIDYDNAGDEIILLSSDHRLFLLDENGNILPDFPLALPDAAYGCPSVSDVDANGTLDIVIGSENFIVIAGYNGEILNAPIKAIELADTLGVAGGALALNLDSDSGLEILSTASLNRFCIWNDHYSLDEYSRYSSLSRNYPVPVSNGDGGINVYVPSDYGKIFRYEIPEADDSVLDAIYWDSPYGNACRTASWIGPEVTAPPVSKGVFVSGEVYVFPNPISEVYRDDLTFNVKVKKDVEVKVGVYDIAGNLVWEHKAVCDANMPNRDKFRMDTSRFSSGLYFIMMRAGGETKKLKFGIER